jgi:N-acetylglucosamine kinase-like BadF-type ATPase
MKYLIGMDGGGTKTTSVITDLSGNKLYDCVGGPSNILTYSAETVSQNIFDLAEKCLSNIGAGFSDLQGIMVGAAGAGRRNDAERLEKSFISLAGSKGILFDKIAVESDARIALEGAFSGRPGSILISGTGSIILGKDAEGIIHRVGGFGRILSDDGSGYSIGRQALNAIAKEFDGRGEHTAITELAQINFNVLSPDILITKIYKENFDVASAALLVFAAAEDNDKVALEIIDKETDSLFLHISSMFKKLNQSGMELAFIGGIISNNNIFSRTLRNKISESFMNIILTEPENPPEIGAVLMIKEKRHNV